jgi:hypothetical protein
VARGHPERRLVVGFNPNAEVGLPPKNAKNTKSMASKILSSAIFGGAGFTAFVHLALRSLRSLAANFGVQV